VYHTRNPEVRLITAPTTTYGDRVPNQPKTPSRSLRIDDVEWQAMAKIAAELGTDRNKLLVQLIRWYLGRPGVVLPQRPESTPDAVPESAE
jgi:hypothetical protein